MGVTPYGRCLSFLLPQFWDLGLWGLASGCCIYGTLMCKGDGRMGVRRGIFSESLTELVE